MHYPRTNRHIPSLALITCLLAWSICLQTALAQVPDEFTNLKVLHKDATKAELLETMKSFTQALGVRCEFCHVGEAGRPLSEFDFASDDKETKRTARVMMQMVQSINNDYVSKVDSGGTHDRWVSCATCHRGHEQPETIREAMDRAYDEGGIAKLLSSYRELREQYYGGAGYDFRENPLVGFATELAARGKPEEAVQVLEMDAEFFPNSANPYLFQSFIKMEAGDTEGAIELVTKALQVEPDNQRAKMMLERLRKQ
jgi:tetratricopeptide (TPR) repeat protein